MAHLVAVAALYGSRVTRLVTLLGDVIFATAVLRHMLEVNRLGGKIGKPCKCAAHAASVVPAYSPAYRCQQHNHQGGSRITHANTMSLLTTQSAGEYSTLNGDPLLWASLGDMAELIAWRGS